MQHNKNLCIILVTVSMLLVAHATIFKGTHENVDFNSNPLGASIYVNGMPRGTTPLSLKLESKETYTIEFRKEEYTTKVFAITNHIGEGWIVLDILAGLLPVLVDISTGAWYELDQKNVNAILEKQQ